MSGDGSEVYQSKAGEVSVERMDKAIRTLSQLKAGIVIEHVMPRHATAFLFAGVTSTPQLKAELMVQSWEDEARQNPF